MSVIRIIANFGANPTSGTLELTTTTGRVIDIKPGLMKAVNDVSNNLVYLYDASQSQLSVGINVFEPSYYTLDPTVIGYPDSTTMYVALQPMLNAGGDASASNQVLEIAALNQLILMEQEGNFQNSVFKNPANNLSWFQNFLPMQSEAFIVLTRPANVTPYTIGDAIMDNVPQVLKLPSAAIVDGIFCLIDIAVTDNSNVAVKPIFNYFFFGQQPPIQVDNLPISNTDSFNTSNFIGAVSGSDLSTVVSPTNTNSIQYKNIPGGLIGISGTPDVYVVIGLANAYIPTSQEQFTFRFRWK